MNSDKSNEDNVLICSTYCEAKKYIVKDSNTRVIESNSCFAHMLDEEIINYIIESGGYLISLGWLENWEENIKNMGF